MSARRTAPLVAMLALAGCDYFAAPDPLDLDPDAISIAIVLVAGQSDAQLLAGYPHRSSGAPPTVSASLSGPGWKTTFSYTSDPEAGCGGGPTDWGIPMVCLNAALPEPIREGATYGLEGEGPKGSFTGETVVPSAPLILDPADTLWMSLSSDSAYWFEVPIRYRAPPEVGTLRPEAFATFSDSTGTRSRWISVWPRLDVNAEADTLRMARDDRLTEISLHLLGIGWHYTNFLRADENHYPWGSFGVEGEGVYGYFDGSSKSGSVHIVIVEEHP